MEFTYDGLVRYTFGFQNPNHAAALIVLLLPWTWAGLTCKSWLLRLSSACACLLLIIALTLTYSRTGMLVLLLESVIFACLTWRSILARVPTKPSDNSPGTDTTTAKINKQQTKLSVKLRQSRNRLIICTLTIITAFVVTALATGATGRLTTWLTNPDKAVTNRFTIWRGGLELFATNPGGVGLGNSGQLYTSFIAPENSGIEVRTLVNTFLTPLVEFGAGYSIVGLTILFFSLFSNLRRQNILTCAAATVLCGLLLSGLFSTCIDLNALINPDLGWTLLQRGMTGLLCLLALATVFYLSLLGLRQLSVKRQLLLSFATALLTIVSLYAAGRSFDSGNAPTIVQVDNDHLALLPPSKAADAISKNGLLLYDNQFSLTDSVRWLRQWYPDVCMQLPLTAWHKRADPPKNVDINQIYDIVVLQGVCAYFADRFPYAQVILISPPEGIAAQENIKQLFLRRYQEKNPWANQENSQIQVEYY